jgi:hypothetical protein
LYIVLLPANFIFRWVAEVVAKHVSVDGGLYQQLRWDTQRAKDFQGICQIIFCCEDVEAKKTGMTASTLEKWLARPEVPTKEFRQQIDSTMYCYSQLAALKDEQHSPFSQVEQRLAPAEFVFIGKAILCVTTSVFLNIICRNIDISNDT